MTSLNSKTKELTNAELLNTTFETFKKFYKNNVKQVEVESIINGEVVETSPDNIFVDEESRIELKNIDKQQKFCNKVLYDYQVEAIRKIRDLEVHGHVEKIDQEGNKYRINSNGWLLKLPIGSGKTLVFTFLAMFYNNVPANPILVSTSGVHIPSNDMIKLNNYPYYYENVGYIEKYDDEVGDYVPVENCGVVLENYNQRKLTVIITHHHLMSQMQDYIKSDFKPAFLRSKRIVYATRVSDIKPKDIYGDNCCDILVVSCDSNIMKKLVEYSYEAPFMRIIIDDYTNMIGIDEFRQILATSTILVSGSGFEREKDKIPPSYYTLKHLDFEKFSLVADPEKTKKGIMRNSIATLELQCADTQFSLYSFTDEVEEMSLNCFNKLPIQLYKPISQTGNIVDYLRLNFIEKNLSRLSTAILNVEADIKADKLDTNRIKYYFNWKEMMKEPIEYVAQDRRGKEIVKSEVSTLTEKLYQPNPVTKQDVPALVHQICGCCKKGSEYHYDWGFVSSCCGSFFCEDCLKSMTTRDIVIVDHDDNQLENRKDHEHYYCTVCYGKDPVFILNTCRNKNNNLQPYNMITNNFEVDDITKNNGLKFDLYFKMLMKGFIPRNHLGSNIVVKMKEVREQIEIQQLFARDRLGILTFNSIEETLINLNITPNKNTTIPPSIIVYGCPDKVQTRVKNYYDEIFKNNPDSPLYRIELMFIANMSRLIGLHKNILGIVVWESPSAKDEIKQLIGRIMRVNSWGNPLYFYINCRSINVIELS